MDYYFETKDLSVGYNGSPLIHNICVGIEKGKILTLIGPNGAGKSTILKSVTRQLAILKGSVCLDGQSLQTLPVKELAKQLAVVLTDRVRPELMTCAEVVAMGRYPYTNLFGKLTPRDEAAVEQALEKVHALNLAGQDFTTLSDGQRQRILLARAICQEPEVIILDEPTAYLDIRHKIELLDILGEMARQQHITVVMSLHEIDLAMKVSDYLLCVKGDTVYAFGTPEEILAHHSIEDLYDMDKGSFNLQFGSVELPKPVGVPRLFVIGGGGKGIDFYRGLQKRQIPFAAGVLFENDLDYPVAAALSDHVLSTPAFSPVPEEILEEASRLMCRCEGVIDAGTPVGPYNACNQALLTLARERQLPIYHSLSEV